MINNFSKLFKIAATAVIGSLILINCESDADQLGSQFFQNGAQGTEATYPLISYNVDNGDTIRTDAIRLNSATLGAFTEAKFGTQKTSYVTQVRLNGYTPDFGTNPIIDSAVLVIKPLYAADSVKTTTVDDYIYPVGLIPAKKVVSNYPITKYGNTKIGGKTTFNIKVNEVTDFLGSNADQIKSNKVVATGGVIGSKVFKGDITAIKITKDADNSTVYEREASLRIPLDSTFFQNKILKAPAASLSDAATFIRYFKGIKLSVLENDGYIFNFDPNAIAINIYYQKDVVGGPIPSREAAVYTLDLGNSNTHFSQISFDRTGTPSATALATANQVTGDPKIYAQGMGGPGIGLRISAPDLANIKNLYNNDKIGIVSAKFRIYTDDSWSNKYKKPDYFVVRQKDLSKPIGEQNLNDYLVDLQTLAFTGLYNLVKAYDLDKNPSYYDIGVTQSVKNIVEKEAKNNDFILNVGNYTTDEKGSLTGLQFTYLGEQNFNTRSFTPFRAVFVGTDSGNPRSAKLILTYGKK